MINSSTAGFSKVVTIGSEYRVTGADYLQWLPVDDDTSVIGLVLKWIPDADRFADAVDLVHAAGKSMVVLKVGRSATGARATLAHTGALIRNDDAFKGFVGRYGIPVVDDYEELIAALEAFAVSKKRPTQGYVGLMGISGGELRSPAISVTRSTCRWRILAGHRRRLARRAARHRGQNPLDIGQSVGRQAAAALAGMTAIMKAEEVGIGSCCQDTRHRAREAVTELYRPPRHVRRAQPYRRQADRGDFPTAEVMGERLLAQLEGTSVPPLRGLWPGLAAVKSMLHWAGRKPDPRRLGDRTLAPERAGMRQEMAAMRGPLPSKLASRLLASYGIPVVKSVVARSAAEALTLAGQIGYPMVVKVASADVPHRSDVGAVQLGIRNETDLAGALALIEKNVREKVPGAAIDGYEMQEELIDCVQAMVGYQAAPPYGALTIVGSGGVLVELEADKALSLSPMTSAEAGVLLAATRLGKTLDGYRNLIPRTDTAPLAVLVSHLSELAADFSDLVPECDLNPVLVRKGSGDVRVVDALFVARRSVKCQEK